MKQLTAEERAQAQAFVARHKCGKLVAVMVAPTADDNKEYRRDCAKETAAWIRKGYTLETTTVEQARRGPWCDCFDKLRTSENPAPAIQTCAL